MDFTTGLRTSNRTKKDILRIMSQVPKLLFPTLVAHVFHLEIKQVRGNDTIDHELAEAFQLGLARIDTTPNQDLLGPKIPMQIASTDQS